MSSMTKLTAHSSIFKITRRGRKLQAYDEQRMLQALPKDVPERTWAEILQKEENDLLIFEIREDILEDALQICYANYMEKQTSKFAAHCAAEAWLKIIDWYFYRHDPGEDESAYPPCDIPNRDESWIPDELPDPSPKDSWAKQDLNVLDENQDEILQSSPSGRSLEFPVVEEIPEEYWFPGKVWVPTNEEEEMIEDTDSSSRTARNKTKKGQLATKKQSWSSDSSSDGIVSTSHTTLNAESEVLQKVTDYSTEITSPKPSSGWSAIKSSTMEGTLRGAGDSTVDRTRSMSRRRINEKSSTLKPFGGSGAKSRGSLPALTVDRSRSRISIISDCRLRNLRLDTQYEIDSEKVETPPGENSRKK